MPERDPARFTWENGYWPTTALAFGVPNTLVGGRNMWNRGKGLMVTSKGFGSAVANSGGSVNPLLNVGSGYGGLTGGGSIFQAFGAGIYFFAGAGTAFVDGVSRGSVLGGTITISLSPGSSSQAGIIAPGAPTVADSGAAGYNNGNYSIGLTAIRSATGGESTISPPSNALSVVNHGINITSFGAAGLDPHADRIGIYVTKRGFGSIGPLFHFYDIAIPTLPYTIRLHPTDTAGWLDAQLGDLAPLDYSLPPVCTHCFVINSVVVAAGCYGGAGLSPSFPNKPEAYPTRFVVFIPGGGTITAVKGSGTEGAVLVCTASSLNLVTASQSRISPLNVNPIWPTTGVASGNQLCTIGSEIYAWIGTRGPVRDRYSVSGSSGDDPGDEATAFAAPVMKFFAANNYNARNCVVVYDPLNDAVWFINGTVGIAYMRHLEQWSLPMDMPSAGIVTGATVTDIASGAGRALVSDASGNLFTPETGTGTSWSLVTQMQTGEFASFYKTILGADAAVDGACRLDIFTNLDIITPHVDGTNKTAGDKHGAFTHLNIQRAKTFGVGLSGTDTGGKEKYGVELLYNTHPVRL